MTPGAYIRARRTAAGMSVADVAAAIATEPRVPENGRVEWLDAIEADISPMRFDTLVVLRKLFPFSLDVLEQLVRISLGADINPPQLCRICSCSEHDACRVDHLGVRAANGRFGCGWFEPDLCTACAGPQEPTELAA